MKQRVPSCRNMMERSRWMKPRSVSPGCTGKIWSGRMGPWKIHSTAMSTIKPASRCISATGTTPARLVGLASDTGFRVGHRHNCGKSPAYLGQVWMLYAAQVGRVMGDATICERQETDDQAGVPSRDGAGPSTVKLAAGEVKKEKFAVKGRTLGSSLPRTHEEQTHHAPTGALTVIKASRYGQDGQPVHRPVAFWKSPARNNSFRALRYWQRKMMSKISDRFCWTSNNLYQSL